MSNTSRQQAVNPGDTVTVYQKPLTREDPEGEATVISIISFNPVTGEYRCSVRFEGEANSYMRSIYPRLD